jgi:hypothetical protein
MTTLLTSRAFAQEEMDGTSTAEEQTGEAKFAFHREDYILSLSYVQWNEKVNLQSGTVVDQDTANFVGTTLNAEKNFGYARWGWAIGATVGTGKASGGGNSSVIAFQKGNQAWTTYGGYAKIYHKTSGRVALGLVAPLLFRQISWPNDPNGYPVDSGKNVNTGLLFEINFRISRSFDFFQDIGPFSSAEGATLWRIGLGYRL